MTTHHQIGDNQPPARRRDYSLFFFEHRGNKTFLRFTPLGVTLIVLLTVVPLIIMFVLLFANSRTELKINSNVPLKTTTPYSANKPLIQLPPAQSPPKVRQQPQTKVPNPLTELPANSGNEQPQTRPKATPQNSSRPANFQHHGL